MRDMEYKYVIVAGFFASGSSAVVDLLRELRGFYECRAEIRIIKDPYGVKQLEHALVEDWDVVPSTAAVSDFLELCQKCGRIGGGKNLLARYGQSYCKTINPKFQEITREYVESLTDYHYQADYYHYKQKKSYLRYVTDRCRWAVEHVTHGKLKTANRHTKPCYFAKPSREAFERKTKEYFDKLFEPFFDSGEYQHIILDQALSPNDGDYIDRYFSSAKMIVIDRDPRDMFADDLQNEQSLDALRRSREYAEYYISRQRAMRERIDQNNPNILCVRFERLVLDYEKEILRIFDFLGVDKEDHIRPRSCLIPEKSAKNVGIWRKYLPELEQTMDLIAKELPELCWNGAENNATSQ